MNRTTLLVTLALITLLLLGACNNNRSSPSEYAIEVFNLSENQPLSPLAIILHHQGFHIYRPGDSATTALEQLAEGGDPTVIQTSADTLPEVLTSTAGTTPTLPGASRRFTLKALAQDIQLSLAGMLVNTNDGFVGVDAIDLSQLLPGDTLNLKANVYDAGTELNTELMSTIPGLGGEGFNITRDDSDAISIHAGIISQADGLSTSGLDQSHRFDNPAVRITVTRTL